MDKKPTREGSPLQDIQYMPTKPSLNTKYKVFQHVISLIDDETSSTYDMLTENGINSIIDFLGMSFKDIESIEFRVDNRRGKLGLVNTNRLKVLNPFTYIIHRKHHL